MRIASPKNESFEPNMTPMIDIVFLLMTFFIMVINFSQAESNEAVHLPDSELAQPPETPPSEPMTVQVDADENIYLGSARCWLDPGAVQPGARPLAEVLSEELNMKKVVSEIRPEDITLIIRADADASVGFVQRVIQTCQSVGIVTFTLRAKHGGEGFAGSPESEGGFQPL
ncbi:MAG: biopolymer transporter ExbD [Thermoguttaceae bacterium]|nr:biopolymer transporter ExbD [Thermoguttaceae bacterium]MBR6481442.1 biopolymer transporter ExbD [Thermoguttaceae bacterium]